MRGKIETSYAVRCGHPHCEVRAATYKVDSPEAAAIQFINQGWTDSPSNGWVCPGHAVATENLRLIENIDQLNSVTLRRLRNVASDNLAAARVNGEAAKVKAEMARITLIDETLTRRDMLRRQSIMNELDSNGGWDNL